MCPGRGSSAPFRHRLPRNFAPSASNVLGGGEISWLAAGPGRGVYVCPVDPPPGPALRWGDVARDVAIECSSEVEQSSIRAPHRLLASSGGFMGCLGFCCVFCISEPPLSSRDLPISMRGLRDALGMQQPVLSVVSGGCEDVRTPLPAFCERSPALQTPPNPKRLSRCCRGSTTSTTRSRHNREAGVG
jgi:hypothetical protein